MDAPTVGHPVVRDGERAVLRPVRLGADPERGAGIVLARRRGTLRQTGVVAGLRAADASRRVDAEAVLPLPLGGLLRPAFLPGGDGDRQRLDRRAAVRPGCGPRRRSRRSCSCSPRTGQTPALRYIHQTQLVYLERTGALDRNTFEAHFGRRDAGRLLSPRPDPRRRRPEAGDPAGGDDLRLGFRSADLLPRRPRGGQPLFLRGARLRRVGAARVESGANPRPDRQTRPRYSSSIARTASTG